MNNDALNETLSNLRRMTYKINREIGLKAIEQNNLNNTDDGSNTVIIIVVVIIFALIVTFGVLVALARRGVFDKIIRNVSANNPRLGAALNRVSGTADRDEAAAAAAAAAAEGGSRAPGAPSTRARSPAMTAQAVIAAAQNDSVLQGILNDLGSGAPFIVASIGVDIAAQLAANQRSIAKFIMERGLKKGSTKVIAEKGASKVLKRTFTGRMSKVFGRLTTKAIGQLGARWPKLAAKMGINMAKLEARLAAEAAERGAEYAAKQAALLASKTAAKQAITLDLGPIGWLYDAVTVVGIALDVTNAGNFAQLTQTSDLLAIKRDIDREVVNVNLACSTVPPTADCPMEPGSVPEPDPDTEPKPGRYPSFVGPLDKEQSDDYDAFYTKLTDKVIDLVTTKPYTPRVQALFDACNLQYAQIFVDAFSQAGIDPSTMEIPQISDESFSQLFRSYWSDEDNDYFFDKAFNELCIEAGGESFNPGPGYDMQCGYKTEEQCHAAYPWPASSDTEDLTYTEWRAKSWFNQFRDTAGANTLDMSKIPEGGACISASQGLHQMCDEVITTGEGMSAASAVNNYIRNTGECVNSQELCRIKGVSYAQAMDPSSMAYLTDHPLPSCYVNDAQRACEEAVGVTICRALESGADARGAQGLMDLDIQTDNAAEDFFANQAEGFAASVGGNYLIGREGLQAGFAVMAGGQQTYDQIESGLNDVVNAADAQMNNLVDRASEGSVTAALALPGAAVVAGVSLAFAALGSAFSALDTVVAIHRNDNYPPPAWCSRPPDCRPGEWQTYRGDNNVSCPTFSCDCPGRVTNGICCESIYADGVQTDQGLVCRAWPMPTWYTGLETTCPPRVTGTGGTRQDGYLDVNCRVENVCQETWAGYNYDYDTGEYTPAFETVCSNENVCDTVPNIVPDPIVSTPVYNRNDPRGYGNHETDYDKTAFCAGAMSQAEWEKLDRDAADAAAAAAQAQADTEAQWNAVYGNSFDQSWYTAS